MSNANACKTRRWVAMITSFAVVIALSACASASPRIPAPADGLAWTPFRWISITIGGRRFDKGALFVPITADTLGGTYWLQLDTGAESDIWLYTSPLKQLLARHGAVRDTTTAFVIPRGSIGPYPLKDHAVNIRRVTGDTVRADVRYPKIGTLGLNFFRHRLLLLDFPGERFAILDSGMTIPRWIDESARWVPLEYRNDKMFLPLMVDGTAYDDFFYDTGASLFPISTTKEIWQRTTGRTGNEADNVLWTVRSFGADATFIGAPARGAISVASAAIERPMVYFFSSGPERLRIENWRFARGLIGNVLFAERYLVIIDLPCRRFGLVDRRRK